MAEISPEVLAKARAIAEKHAAKYKQLIDAFKDAPEPECKKCGRIIYCGASKLCSVTNCGLRTRDNDGRDNEHV